MMSNNSDIKNQVILLNAQHAFFFSKDPLAMFLTVLMVFSAGSRVVSNSVVFVAIIRQKALRLSKEFLMMAVLALLDAIMGNHHTCLFLIHYGTSSTRVQCLFTVRNICHLLGSQSSGFMLMLISIDRLIGVRMPLWYYGQTVIFVYKLLAILLSFHTIIIGYQLYYVFSIPDQVVPYCLTTHTFLDAFHVDVFLLKFWLTCSCVIYLIVIILHKRYMRTTVMPTTNNNKNDREWLEYRKRTHAVTVTFGISALVTFFMAVIPLVGSAVLRYLIPSMQVAGWALLIPFEWSAVVNLFLYMKRHGEVSKAVVALFKCKSLPEDLRNWAPTVQIEMNQKQPNGNKRAFVKVEHHAASPAKDEQQQAVIEDYSSAQANH